MFLVTMKVENSPGEFVHIDPSQIEQIHCDHLIMRSRSRVDLTRDAAQLLITLMIKHHIVDYVVELKHPPKHDYEGAVTRLTPEDPAYYGE